MRIPALLCAIAAAAALPASAAADFGLFLRRSAVHPGDRVTVWSNGCTGRVAMRVYVVPARFHRSDTTFVPRAPRGRPYRYVGRFRCTHTKNPQPLPGGGRWTATIAFRFPHLAPGWVKIVMYCAPCHNPGGSLIAASTYFDGKRQHYIGRGLRVRPR